MRDAGGRTILAAILAIAACGAPGEAAGQEPRGGRRGPSSAEQRAVTNEAALLIERANQLVQLNRCAEAIPILERLVKEFPQVGLAPELLSGCYLKTGRPQDVVPLLERGLAIEPERFAFIRDLGLAYLELDRREDAVAVWRRALKTGEQYAAIYGIVAKLEQEAGLYDEAIATYRAGTAYRPYAEHYTNEIIRLERMLGRHDAALRELLAMMKRRDDPLENDIRTAVTIYRDAKDRGSLAAIADSAAAAGGERAGVFRAIKAVFLVEDGRPAEAEAAILGERAGQPAERELYAVLSYLIRARREEGEAAHDEFLGAAGARFLERYPESPLAPPVLLLLAENAREGARSAGSAGRTAELERALSLAGDARSHRAGAPHAERATMLRAEILLEDLRRGDEALRELDQIRRRAPRSSAVEELRMRALLASRDRDEAERRLRALAADADSNAALVGAYGLGALAFRKGSYGAAAKALSELAEKHPASPLANDALETALDLAAAMREGTDALDLYRGAVIARERGNGGAAVDSLGALERRHPESALAARAIFMRAEIAEEEGREAEASADFERVAERFPAHELAPRALERLAAITERRDVAAALQRYGAIMERYPEYPFMERVRGRYVALGKAAGAGPGKGGK